MDATLAAAGRDPGLDRYLSLDSAPVFSLRSAEFFADQVGRAADLGFTDVVTHWPRASSWYAGDEAVLADVATRLLPELRGLTAPRRTCRPCGRSAATGRGLRWRSAVAAGDQSDRMQTTRAVVH